jgi:hypothetical protein
VQHVTQFLIVFTARCKAGAIGLRSGDFSSRYQSPFEISNVTRVKTLRSR